MNRYYFYASSKSSSWYTFTTSVLRECIKQSRDENGIFNSVFPTAFIFIGKYTEAKDKDEAEENFRRRINLLDGKEPACMLMARRTYYEQSALMI